MTLGSLTGNKEMESEGKMDRRAGHAKEEVRRVKKSKVDAAPETVERKAVQATDIARDAAPPT